MHIFDVVILRDSVVMAVMTGFCTAAFLTARRRAKRLGRVYRKSEVFSVACLFATAALVLVQCVMSMVVAQWQLRYYGNKDLQVGSAPDVEFELQDKFQIDTFVQFFAHNVGMWLLKASYLAQFYGMADSFNRGRKAVLHFTGALNVVGIVSTILIFTCWVRPIQANWIRSMLPEDGVVATKMGPLIYLTTIAITADIGIFIVSYYIIRSLTFQGRAERVALGVIFFIGLLSIGACIMRFLILYSFIRASLASASYVGVQCQWLAHLSRMEVVLGTLAYGFVFGRILLNRALNAIATLRSRLRSASPTWESKRFSESECSEREFNCPTLKEGVITYRISVDLSYEDLGGVPDQRSHV